MSKLTFQKSTLALLMLAGATAALAQTTTQLAPAKDRISDEAISADHAAYEQLQNRLHGLNEKGVPVRSYHLAKAQCWLDVSLHEYTRNDRSAFPQEALTESEKLIVGLEKKATDLTTDTTMVNKAARLRPDLWEKTSALKKHAGFQCAQPQIACAEVELVHAGNEQNQQDWRHAKPYVQIAEDLTAQAQQLADSCPAAAAPVVVPAVVPVVAAPTAMPVQMHAEVLFDFDRFGTQNIRPSSRAEVEWLASRIRSEGMTVQSLTLLGYADRLNSTGKQDYNVDLSQKRVDTVRALLASLGLTVSEVKAEARGDSEQVKTCDALPKKSSQLRDCLLPNRRVTIQVNGVVPVKR